MEFWIVSIVIICGKKNSIKMNYIYTSWFFIFTIVPFYKINYNIMLTTDQINIIEAWWLIS